MLNHEDTNMKANRPKKRFHVFWFICRWWFTYGVFGGIVFICGIAPFVPLFCSDCRPGDLFSGQALIYKPAEKGYLFYSVGVNGKDDEGRWYNDKPSGDDPGVRMPLPPLKKE